MYDCEVIRVKIYFDFVHKGEYSKCYELESGSILKLFNRPQNLLEIDKFRYMLDHKNKSFLFPFDFIYDQEKFYGHITKKSLGIPLNSSFSSSNLEQLSNHSSLLEKNIIKISKAKILVDDFQEGNIMYDGKRLEVIGTDFYEAPVPFSVRELKKDNLRYYKLVISRLFKEELKYLEDTEFIFNQIDKYFMEDVSASDMIMLIKKDIERYYKEDIDTINQVKKIVRR